MSENRVHIQKCNELSTDVKKALDAINWGNIIQAGYKVVIKVNMCDSLPKKGVITTPALVYEVIKILKSRDCHVTVVESDGLLYSADKAYKETGMKEWVEKAGAIFVNLTKNDKDLIDIDKSLFIKSYNMPKVLDEADAIITMPLLKTHEVTLYTGALKNQFGCFSQHNRIMLHSHLNEAIVDINTILKPDLVIMDALIAIEGNGPTRGYPVKMDLIITANNPISCDLVAVELMGLNPKKIDHLWLAKELNPGSDIYTITGDRLDSVKRTFKQPYDDLGNKAQKFILNHRSLTKIFFDSPINSTVVKIGRLYRKWALRDKTEYF